MLPQGETAQVCADLIARVDLHEQEPLRDDAPLATPRQARVLNRVLKKEQDARAHSRIPLIN